MKMKLCVFNLFLILPYVVGQSGQQQPYQQGQQDGQRVQLQVQLTQQQEELAALDGVRVDPCRDALVQRSVAACPLKMLAGC